MDIQREREAFEMLPAVAELIKTNNVWWSEVHGDYFGSDHELDCWIDGAWAVWQAKAQAVPEPSINMTGHDLKYIWDFMDYADPENLDTEVTIQLCKEGFDGAGLYAWVAEYPEEGGIKLGEAQEPAKAQAVSEVVAIGGELQSWVAVHSFAADDGEGMLPVIDANAIAEKIEELTGASQ